jgi:DNA-directed RNA polymerase specialized sigma24 family protein
MITIDSVTDMLWLWDCGFNTKEIADRLCITESEVDRQLRLAREERRIKRQGMWNDIA